MRFDIMVFQKMDEEQRKIMVIDQEKLDKKKKMKSEGSGVLILAIAFIILGIANQAVFGILYDSSVTQLLITIGSLLLGVAGCVFGVKLLGKTGESVAEIIRSWNENLYTLEDIHDFYREVRDDKDTLIFLANKKKVKEEDAAAVGLLTKNWLKIPGQRGARIARITDIVAAWHDKEGYTEYGYKGLYILRGDGELYGMDCHENFSEKVMEEIGKRNPLTILERRFTYEGNNYDVYSNKDQVIAIYKENLDRQLL